MYLQLNLQILKDMETSLQKFEFCKDLKKFFKDLYYSQRKIGQFFLNELEFHRVFIEENQLRYKNKIQSMKDTCNKCKESVVLKSFQHVKQSLNYQFQDPFKMYQKQRVMNQLNSSQQNALKNVENIFDYSNLAKFHQFNSGQCSPSQVSFPLNSYDISLAQLKLNKILNESKKMNQNPLQQIIDMFDHKQQAQINSINRVKINEMFYDLQNQLDNRANQIGEYLQQLMSFNDRLINYNPNLSHHNKVEGFYLDETEPGVVENQLKINFKNIIKKIYKKVTEIIQKRKDQSISVETQANFNQDNVIKQLEKQKKKLTIQLKKTQQDKIFLTNNLKQQNQKFKKQILRLSQQRVKFEITKDEAVIQKNSLQKQYDKMVKVIDQMKREIQRVNYLLQRQKKSNNLLKNQVRIAGNRRAGTMKEGNDGLEKNRSTLMEEQEKLSQQRKSTANKQKTQEQKALLQQFQRSQLELINNLAKKRAKSRKKFNAPRRSKLLQTIQIQESILSQQVSRFSKSINQQDMKPLKSHAKKSSRSSSSRSSKSLSQQSSPRSSLENIDERQPTLGLNIIEQNFCGENQQKTINNIKQNNVPIKNHKSKTYTQLKKEVNLDQEYNHGQSSKEISQTSEDIHRQLEELQKMKKMKQLEIKLSNIRKKDEEERKSNTKNNKMQRSTIGFHIEKQIDQNIKGRKEKGSSLSKNRLQSKSLLHSNSSNSKFALKSNIKLSKQQQPNKNLNKNKKSDKQPRRSSISINSKNYLTLIDQIYKDIEQNRTHVGIQTSPFIDHELLRILYQYEIQNRKWNLMILTFDAYKFGYQEFVSQLTALIGKEQKNPIRKLNDFKGSSSVLKKSHNYRFNKQNLFMNTWKSDVDGDKSNMLSALDGKTSNAQKQYFLPRSVNDRLQSNNQNNKYYQMNQTMGNFATKSFYNNSKNDQSTLQISNHIFKPINCVTISDFKNIQNLYNKAPFTEKQNDFDSIGKSFKKKGFYTLHHVKTDNFNSINMISEEDESAKGDNQKLSTEFEQNQLEAKKMIRLPSFQKQDVENLFFSIQSAKIFQDKLQNNKLQQNFMALEQNQIHYTTQFLALLAQIHLIQVKLYEQIKNVLLYPVKILNSMNGTNNGFYRNQQSKVDKEEQKQGEDLSLKKGLGYIIQLHRKCKCQRQLLNIRNNQDNKLLKFKGKSRQKGANLQILKRKPLCGHLLNFKRKVGDVLRGHYEQKR